MGLVLDSCILIHAERRGALDFSPWASHGDAFISAITVSELLVGVHRADSDARRHREPEVRVGEGSVLEGFRSQDFNGEFADAIVRGGIRDARDLGVGRRRKIVGALVDYAVGEQASRFAERASCRPPIRRSPGSSWRLPRRPSDIPIC